MDFKKAQSFAQQRYELDDALQNVTTGETGHESLTPDERFSQLWGRGMVVLTGGQDLEKVTGGTMLLPGRTESGIPFWLQLTLSHMQPLPHFVDIKSRQAMPIPKIETSWLTCDPKDPMSTIESIGRPETITGLDVANTSLVRHNNPSMLNRLGLLEESMTAAEMLLDSATDQGIKPVLFVTNLRPVAA